MLPALVAMLPRNWEHPLRAIADTMQNVYEIYVDIRNCRGSLDFFFSLVPT